ncbi:MAG: hypothetical protein MJ180_00100 [Candidatus Gastranaerophilales bacterium]|nr:hypothetical protein [Candidatus Gastranaerophilales bacterium]
MLTFNLKKEWFNKIKSGEKTHEYREVKSYWTKRIMKSMYHEYITDDDYFIRMCYGCGNYWNPIDGKIVFCCGYPQKSDKEKRLNAVIKKVLIRNGMNTDLKIAKKVFDIEFELIKGE